MDSFYLTMGTVWSVSEILYLSACEHLPKHWAIQAMFPKSHRQLADFKWHRQMGRPPQRAPSRPAARPPRLPPGTNSAAINVSSASIYFR